MLELVEGPTLADRIAHGAMPIDDALPIAKQIAEALEAAHEAGVIHRDLKPANIKVREDGTVKVLDFGLAKAFQPEAGDASASMSPTISLTAAATQMGIVIGTAAYMAPEQAKGRPVDKRADVWAFGAVLFEMLTGARVFAGRDVSDTLAYVLTREIDWTPLPAATPPTIRRVLRRCLERDPKRRLRDIGDARLDIEEPPSEPVSSNSDQPPVTRWRAIAATGVASAAAAAALVLAISSTPTAPAQPTRFTIRTPSDQPLNEFAPVALSPDGRRLAFVAGLGEDQTRLYLHDLDSFEARAVDDAAGGYAPFFSPDGESVGFQFGFVGGLSSVRVTGGAPTTLVGDIVGYGATWGTDGTLVLTGNWGQPLRIRDPDTGELSELAPVDTEGGEGAHLWPQMLPGDRRAIFTIWTGASWDEALIAVVDLETGARTIIMRDGTYGRYAASGHLVFWRGGTLMAAPFDLATATVTGPSVSVVDGVRLVVGSGSADFAISETGTLAYVAGRQDSFAESFVTDRSGQVLLRLDASDAVGQPAFSPDARRIALTLFQQGTYGVGVFDLERELLTPIALGRDNLHATWTPDGQQVTYLSNADGDYNHYLAPFDGSRSGVAIFPEDHGQCCWPAGWFPDGEHLVYTSDDAGLDVWIRSGDQAPAPLIQSPANEAGAVFSPDGRFLAYQSDESGQNEVWVRPFPNVELRRWQISEAGGRRPRWSRGGAEIVYVTDNGVMRVPISDGPQPDTLTVGRATLLFELAGIREFDVSADGERLAFERLPLETASREIRVVLNWFEELKRLVPID